MLPTDLIIIDKIPLLPKLHQGIMHRFVQSVLDEKGIQLKDNASIVKFFARMPAPRADVEQIVAVLKIVCEVTSLINTGICPIINGLP